MLFWIVVEFYFFLFVLLGFKICFYFFFSRNRYSEGLRTYVYVYMCVLLKEGMVIVVWIEFLFGFVGWGSWFLFLVFVFRRFVSILRIIWCGCWFFMWLTCFGSFSIVVGFNVMVTGVVCVAILALVFFCILVLVVFV